MHPGCTGLRLQLTLTKLSIYGKCIELEAVACTQGACTIYGKCIELKAVACKGIYTFIGPAFGGGGCCIH